MWLSLMGVMCAVAPMQASADDLPAAPRKPVKTHVAKTPAAKPPATKGATLGAVPFSNPYAPPVGAGKAAGAVFPASQAAAPVDPKGGVSFTYKWKATNEPTDPYWHVRSSPGSEAPGDTFLGGLKLGF